MPRSGVSRRAAFRSTSRRTLRGVPRRRRPDHRDELPSGRLCPLPGLRRAPLQPRDARGALPQQDHRRRAGHVRDRGAGVLWEHPADQAQAADPLRCGLGLRAPGPARHDTLRRRGPAREARQGAPPPADPERPSTSSTSPPRACTSRTCASWSRCSRSSWTPATRCS